MDEISKLHIVNQDLDTATSLYQNFELFPAFLPESLESLVGKPAFGGHMLEFLPRLGLRSASAATMQLVTFYLLAATEGVEKTVAFTSDSRYSMYVATKGWFRRLVKSRSAPRGEVGNFVRIAS